MPRILLKDAYPDIAKEWHPTKNSSQELNTMTASNPKKIWWLGQCNHEWEAQVFARTKRSNGCPFCSGKYVLKGFNDLATVNPLIASQWHPTLNSKLPSELVANARYKAWWVGDCKHEWESFVYTRHQTNSGCPFCLGQSVLVGFNDLATINPVVASEWHLTKNILLSSEITAVSNRVFWWQCKKGHEWEAKVSTRSGGGKRRAKGCPVCKNRAVLVGDNDMATLYPDVAAQWHPTKNISKPEDYVPGSADKMWWLCDKGHEWEATISRRAKHNRGCHVCTNRVIIAGFNDFASLKPELTAEWHVLKNGKSKPDQFSTGSRFLAWWVCDKAHEWKVSIAARSTGRGCNKCSNNISKAENEIKGLLVSWGLTVEQSNRKILKGQELDLFIPAQKIAVEYNGLYWHSEANGKLKDYHYNKWSACKGQGIQLIQVWEDDWRERKEIVVRSLKAKLGLSDLPKVSARKTVVKRVNAKTMRKFLELNHIQGFAAGAYYYILVEKGDVLENPIAGMVIASKVTSMGIREFHIQRYATSMNVMGGFSKLLSVVEREHYELFDVIISFSNHSISDGGLYEKNGFMVDYIQAPTYSFVFKGNRVHRYNFNDNVFRRSSELLYVEGLSILALAELNGIAKVWDSGKTRWVKEKPLNSAS